MTATHSADQNEAPNVDQDGLTPEERAAEDARKRAEATAAAADEEAALRRQQMQSKFLNTTHVLRSLWSGVDPNSEDFAYGVQLINTLAQDAKTGMLNMETVNGTKCCWLQERDKDGKVTSEFIGLTKGMAKNQPLNENIADELMVIVKARNVSGKPITLVGTPEECDMLWLAAMKAGLEVEGFNPSAAFKEKWEQHNKVAAGVTLAADEPDAATPETFAPEATEASEETPTAEAETPTAPQTPSRFAGPASIAGYIAPDALEAFDAADVADLLTEERLNSYTPEELKQTVAHLETRMNDDAHDLGTRQSLEGALTIAQTVLDNKTAGPQEAVLDSRYLTAQTPDVSDDTNGTTPTVRRFPPAEPPAPKGP